MKIETIAVHGGHAVDPATGAVASPIYLSTTFERDIEGTYSRGFMYARNDNPNRQALERGVSMLEGDFVDMSDPDAVRKALRPNTKLAWAETPSNPLLKIVDLGAVAEIVRGP